MGRCSGKGVKGMKDLSGRHPCTLTNRSMGLIESTGTLSIWPSRIGQTRATIPPWKEDQGEPDAAYKQAVAA